MVSVAVLVGCAGGRSAAPPVSDTVYTAPGDPTVLASDVSKLASTCWPGRSPELASLRVLKMPHETGGHPTVRLSLPPEQGQGTAETQVIFAVGFKPTGTSITELRFFETPDDIVLAQRLKDDVLLWANGSKSCV